MRRLQFSPSATADIDEIWDYTADRWSEDQADLYIDEIENACSAIASGTKIGRRTDVQIGLHKIRSGSHMIYYRTTEDRMDIIRILHAKQDADRHL